jgi:hypothetical protein
MTATEFARLKGVNYRTVLNWLEKGLVPGAVEKRGPKGKYWYIPRTALEMEAPQRGGEGHRADCRLIPARNHRGWFPYLTIAEIVTKAGE